MNLQIFSARVIGYIILELCFNKVVINKKILHKRITHMYSYSLCSEYNATYILVCDEFRVVMGKQCTSVYKEVD